jgi:glycosyltransferase involved in cell wall biosynthesis
MKILWVNNVFLHPTTRGGQIRTLETLKSLSRRHEIHYVACDDPRTPEGLSSAGEYSARAYGCPFRITVRSNPTLLPKLVKNLFSPLPSLLDRRRSPEMRATVEKLLRETRFDSLVCDFLTPSINLPRLEDWILFQHNVETMIYRRYADTARNPASRWYFRTQAERLFRYERDVCRKVRHVIAVSEADAAVFRDEFGAPRVSAVPTGVDLDYFTPPAQAQTGADLVFVGAMDYQANIQGVDYFVGEILPRIRQRKPGCSVAVVGRNPVPSVRELARHDPLITVSGTVPDIRPYLWGAKAAIVPLRIGGGTRLKIYEAMAACTPVVSTTIGAEGLEVRDSENIYLADTPEAFAMRCVELMESPAERDRLSAAARRMVADRFSWESVAEQFERILRGGAVENAA